MQVNIKSTKIELTDGLRDFIQGKMDMMERYLDGIDVIHADFEIEKTTRHHYKGDVFRAEINLDIPGQLLRVEKTEKDLLKAIEKVKDHMAEEIKKYKNKKIDGRRKGAREAKEFT